MAQELLYFEDVNIYEQHREYSIEGLNFTLNEGEFHTFVGKYPSDAATLWFFLQEGLEYYRYSGKIRFLGKSVQRKNFSDGEAVFVDSDCHLMAPYSVMENIYLMDSAYYKCSQAGKYKKFHELMKHFQISLEPDMRVNLLSEEEQMLVEFLRLYVRRPKVAVLYDALYIFTNRNREKAVMILNELREKYHTGIIYCTTKYEDAIELSDKATAVSEGHVTGMFDGATLKGNPKELLYSIYGWTDLEKRDMVNLFSEAHTILESTTELRKVMEFLAESIVKVLEAESCYIYLMDENRSNLIDVDACAMEGLGDRLNTDFLYECSMIKEICAFTNEEPGYARTFQKEESAERIKIYMLAPVFLREEVIGFIQVNYYQMPENIEGKKEILKNFSRETGISVETSRLMGKSILLQESHHRIKNNLQVIINLLYMHKYEMEDNMEVAEVFDGLVNQVKSIAIVHDLLSNDKLGKNITNLRKIIQSVIGFYQSENIDFEFVLDDISIPYNKASSISLLVNEMVANSIKHAFPKGWMKEKRIRIECTSSGSELYLSFWDNGIGFMTDPLKSHHGMGMNILISTVHKMEGTVIFSTEQGAKIEIRMPREGIYDIG